MIFILQKGCDNCRNYYFNLNKFNKFSLIDSDFYVFI